MAQLVGTKNFPGDYTSLASAINGLNLQGVGLGEVPINLNQPETAPLGGYIIGSLVLNSSTSALNPITPNGNSNTITSNVASSIYSDAMIRIASADYDTLSSFQLVENVSNTTAVTQMERGIWICLFNDKLVTKQ